MSRQIETRIHLWEGKRLLWVVKLFSRNRLKFKKNKAIQSKNQINSRRYSLEKAIRNFIHSTKSIKWFRIKIGWDQTQAVTSSMNMLSTKMITRVSLANLSQTKKHSLKWSLNLTSVQFKISTTHPSVSHWSTTKSSLKKMSSKRKRRIPLILVTSIHLVWMYKIWS